MKISVLVAIDNHSGDLKICKWSVLRSKFDGKFEIVVADQGTLGKPKALNMAINKAKGEYLAFTENDCIVSKYWLKNAVSYLDKNKNIAGVFGNVWPYQPKKHPGKFCPGIFTAKRMVVVENPEIVDLVMVGSENNMVWRKKSIEGIDGFREWLGPGVRLDYALAEDLVKRALNNNQRIAFGSDLVVWHNHWLKKRDFELINGHKTRAMAAIDNKLADKRIKYHLIKMKKYLIYLIKEFLYWGWEILNFIYGKILGLWCRVFGSAR